MADSITVTDMTKCSICMEPFTQPKCLPCIHTFCLECIRALVYTNKLKPRHERKPLTCPTCRHSFREPPGGVDNLPDNFQMKQLVAERYGKGPKCEPCSKVYQDNSPPAKTHCVECGQDLCKSCSTRHGTFKEMATHRLMPLRDWEREKATNESQGRHCASHSDEELMMYCWDCKAAVCVMCWSSDHMHHECCYVGEEPPAHLDTVEEEETQR